MMDRQRKFKESPFNEAAAKFNVTYHPTIHCIWSFHNPTDPYSDCFARTPPDIKEWLDKHCRGPWNLFTTPIDEQAFFCFMNVDDAMLFKLTWL